MISGFVAFPSSLQKLLFVADWCMYFVITCMFHSKLLLSDRL